VLLCSTSDAIAQSVAEHCLMGALAGLRRLTDVDRQMHAGKWPNGSAMPFSLRAFLKKGERVPGAALVKPLVRPLLRQIAPPPKRRAPASGNAAWSDLREQTVGLVGWGHIARHFARLLKPFDCRLLVHSEAVTAEELEANGARRVSLGELLGAARVISIHKGMTEQTHALIGPSQLALIRPGSVLINTARGPIIREDALLARLRQGDVVAVLDVFEREPLPAKHSLRRLPNVILTPHNASTTNECFKRVGQQALDFVRRWSQRETVPALSLQRLERTT
jgi:phosphoglycerate dehydrogenase-like enzyme